MRRKCPRKKVRSGKKDDSLGEAPCAVGEETESAGVVNGGEEFQVQGLPLKSGQGGEGRSQLSQKELRINCSIRGAHSIDTPLLSPHLIKDDVKVKGGRNGRSKGCEGSYPRH